MNRRLLHIAPWVRSVGGVQTLIARHARDDAGLGFDSHCAALFDRPAGCDERGERLGFRWNCTPSAMRRRFRRLGAKHAGSTVVHHGGWGVPLLGDLDGSERRIIFLHDSIRRYAAMLPDLLPWADGVACSSESTAREVRRVWGGDPSRVAVPPQPIFPPALSSLDRPPRAEWVIGHLGRLTRPHKGAHRLVDFVREAHRTGLKFRLEIAGHGPLRGWLERRLAADPAVKFLGWLQGPGYWETLRSWDCAVSFADHEGGPITLLEAMSMGVLPLYPATGGSLGDDYAPQVDPRCHYPPGDVAAAVRAVQALQAEPTEKIAALRRRAVAVVQPHIGGSYVEDFAALVRRVGELPRLSRPGNGGRAPRFTDRLPLGLLTRLLPGAIER